MVSSISNSSTQTSVSQVLQQQEDKVKAQQEQQAQIEQRQAEKRVEETRQNEKPPTDDIRRGQNVNISV